ncbi:hypothetical protein ACWCPF_38455 [Streptomyces sp. NPDC001858]
MTVDQLPGRVREFVNHLNELLARLDQRAGWCAVFWQRDPDGMQACLDGHEIPPWDVVEAVLQDLAAEYGPEVAGREAERVRPLHAGALAAHDARPGGRDALGDRLDVMLREQRYAAERLAELGRRLSSAGTRDQADAVRLDLAWAHDDHERATARCAELRHRIAEFDRLPPSTPSREQTPHTAAGAGYAGATEPVAGRTADVYDVHDAAVPAEVEVPAPAPVPKQRKRRRGSARFAGMVEEEDAAAPVVQPPAAGPAAPAPAPAARRTPRGARFAGAAADGPEGRSEPQRREPVDAAARQQTVEVVERLVRLRGEGRSGEAHALLVELAYWPAARIPLLAAELQRTGLTADWTTLLWEAASLPADRLVAAADALAAVGRTADGEQILRQGVARPAVEIGQAVLGLVRDGRPRDGRALLDAYVRVRTPEEAARSVAPDPQALVPLLLAAARAVSEQRHWDLVHALRVAGFTA